MAKQNKLKITNPNIYKIERETIQRNFSTLYMMSKEFMYLIYKELIRASKIKSDNLLENVCKGRS